MAEDSLGLVALLPSPLGIRTTGKYHHVLPFIRPWGSSFASAIGKHPANGAIPGNSVVGVSQVKTLPAVKHMWSRIAMY